jgi:hypothetical protein
MAPPIRKCHLISESAPRIKPISLEILTSPTHPPTKTNHEKKRNTIYTTTIHNTDITSTTPSFHLSSNGLAFVNGTRNGCKAALSL